MIITQIEGGLGNQLFRYAFGRNIAHKLNTEFKIDANSYLNSSGLYHEKYKLKNYNVQENFATPEEIASLPHLFERSGNGIPGVFNPAIFDLSDNVYLRGFFQSEKYFIDIADIIRREFTLKNPLEKNSAAWRDKILSANCAVSLHVRHGDYLTYESRNVRGLLPLSYYQTCINELRKDYHDITLFVFSDDLAWCRKNFKFDVPTEFIEGCEHDFEEMHLMSLCKHNIISNGTFAWWGAWLNENPDKKVFAPYSWHVGGFGGETIYAEDWIKIPVNYLAGSPPMLSIIFYVENKTATLPIILQSIFSQFERDYEVIFVDASTEGGQICRQAVVNPNVNFITADPSTDKFAAWNKGLSVARGDYVLFLSDKNFIFPHTATILENVCDDFVNRDAGKNKTYMTYATFDNYTPNIVCAVQNLVEDEHGDFNVTELADKKFTLKSDEPFKALNRVVELQVDNRQKLMLLATEQINNFVGTKFFKRKFLAENNIRFNDKGGGTDAELLFAVETFLATDKIIFVPQIFSGRLK
ncbi:MAG: alpha-1,2-fucosyltransferase [Selenomonadaceae bacterium]|nr:alpha-1,2-fucosyltransferase [Selenomonadaceae bacterium]